MRLIDGDALNYVRVRIYHDDGTIGGYNAVVPSSEIKNAPTVDAEPVIRCKDCKWWNGYYSCIRTASDDFDEDDYCSLAEREEE